MSLSRGFAVDSLPFSSFHRRISALSLAFFLVALLILPAELQAQMEFASAQARTTQYVIVVDDSGSMRVRTRDGPAADPDRLAIFATQALLSMLDDRDEVTVVRLNGPHDGEPITPIAPLTENRSQLESALAIDGPIAAYPGQRTPCKSALEALQQELNQAYRPHVNQVVLFLTDGECNDGRLNTDRWLQGIDSHRDGLFQFYLLRWKGRVYSQYLVDLSRQTGATVAQVSADDPTELLGPFASMMSRSQGYEAYRLTPRDRILPAHQGARRIRLLAVAPDQGQDLSFQISATAQGDDPVEIGATRTGLHQYEDGARYRYAALDYRPGSTPVSVSVSGAGNDWAVVALPEYRLFVDARIQTGRCAQEGAETSFSEVGGDICLVIHLVNEDGQPVTGDVSGRGLQGTVLYQSPSDDEPRSLPANRAGDTAAFRFDRVNLTEGDHLFVPQITLQGRDGEGVTIRAAARTLQVSTRRVEADPARLELGDLVPGTEHYHELTIDGNFPSTRGRLQVEGRGYLPECLRFALNGVSEGEAQTITAGQSYTLEVHLDPYCGPSTGDVSIDTALRLQFDRASQSAPIPSLVIPIQGRLLHELRSPASLDLSLRAGQDRDIAVSIRGNHRQEMEFTALLPPTNERTGWPRRHLELEALDDQGRRITPARDGSLSFPVTVAPDPGTDSSFTLRATSGPCCQGGEFRTQLVLVPTAGTQTPLRIPVIIEVEEARLLQCWGSTILRGLIFSLLLLLLAYLINIWRSSHFIDRDRLADRLIPLHWSDFGETRPQTRSATEVRQMVRKSISFPERARAWLLANPLVFGLPGREYNETVELLLSNSRNVHRTRMRLIPERTFIDDLRATPRRGLARVFASARGGLTFHAVPGPHERIGPFQIHDPYAGFHSDDEEFEPTLTALRGRTELLDMNSEKEPETMAGWRLG